LFSTNIFALPRKVQASKVQASSARSCDQRLSQQIEDRINNEPFKRSRWGVLIESSSENETIYELDSDKFFVPASTFKLVTTAVALNELGADFRIKTSIYASGKLPHLNTLRIVGRGDPTLTTENLKNLVNQFKTLGIRSIDQLIIDDSYFAKPLINPTWEWLDTYYYYATSANSVILNQNMARLTLSPQKIGEPVKLVWQDAIASRQWQVFNQTKTVASNQDYSIEVDGLLGKPTLNIRGNLPQNRRSDNWDLAIFDPGQYFLETFRSLLTQSGISVKQGVVSNLAESENTRNRQERAIAQITSPPLSKLLQEANQDSNNLYAEVLLKLLTKELGAKSEIEALELGLKKLGIEPEEFNLADGSGLSRQNLITPQALNKVLTSIAQTTDESTYRNSLALAGVSGTLRNRFRNTELEANLWGKTGSLTGVITLAGYLKLTNQNSVVFSVLLNNFNDKNKIARAAMDEVLLFLTQWQKCLD